MASSPSRPKLLVIIGPTASGKSDLAMRIAKEYNGEIIAADSWTVYKGFDIGTGKPSQTDRKAIKHYLIDVREPTDGFNAPLFKEMAEKAIKNIQKQGKLPILVGGTGLYIDSVLYDFGFLPDVPPDERAKLNAMEISALIKLAEKLSIDLSGVDKRNKRRIIRAIEAGGQKPTKGKLRPSTLIIGLQLPREALRQRVEQRVDKMLNEGLEQEVKELSKKYGWDIEPMKGIGYHDWRAYLDGSQTLEETRQKIISSTMNLAKRQRTWFKRNKNIHWFGSSDDAYNFLKIILSK